MTQEIIDKANEAPEKLYFGERDKGILDIYSDKESDDEVEYVRADAFIEKACNAYCNTCGNSRCSGIGCAKLSTFKEQLNNRL